MDIYIYASPGFGHPRDLIEDAIEEYLGSRGEVTGGGAGASGSNIDIEIFAEVEPIDSILQDLRNLLKDFDVPAGTVITIGGHEYTVYGA